MAQLRQNHDRQSKRHRARPDRKAQALLPDLLPARQCRADRRRQVPGTALPGAGGKVLRPAAPPETGAAEIVYGRTDAAGRTGGLDSAAKRRFGAGNSVPCSRCVASRFCIAGCVARRARPEPLGAASSGADQTRAGDPRAVGTHADARSGLFDVHRHGAERSRRQSHPRGVLERDSNHRDRAAAPAPARSGAACPRPAAG